MPEASRFPRCRFNAVPSKFFRINQMREEILGMFSLEGEVAIVTGALGRLGREYVRALAGAGASVGAIDIAGDRAAFAALDGPDPRIHVELADLSDKAAADRAV